MMARPMPARMMMQYNKQDIKLARRFLKTYQKKIYDARETGKDSKDKYLPKRARYSIKILNWAEQKGI
jgi:hypothetical protein